MASAKHRHKKRVTAFLCLMLTGQSLLAEAPGQLATGNVAFITLGTSGGPVFRRERSEPANAVAIGNCVYLFDVGAGAIRRMAEASLPLEQLCGVFLSHHHIDHVADLGSILTTRWLLNTYTPIPVIGPHGTAGMAEKLIAAARPIELAPVTIGGPVKPSLRSTVIAQDLPSETAVPTLIFEDGNIRVFAITNAHYHFERGSPEEQFSRSYGFRIETRNKIYTYTGDSGPSENLVKLAKGADVLVSEVIDIAGVRATLERVPNLPADVRASLVTHMHQDHLTPVQVGQLGSAAGVKTIVLTHLVPGSDGEADLSGYVKGLGDAFQGDVRIANDLDRF